MSTGNSGPLLKPMSRQKMDGNLSSEVELGEHIQIRINGRPAKPSARESRSVAINNQSSQSMLLDHEEPGISDHPGREKENRIKRNTWGINTDRLSLRPTQGSVQSSYEIPVSESPVALRTTRSSASHPGRPQTSVSRFSPRSQSQDKSNESVCQTEIHCLAPESPELPVRRHFTIDDQISAENMHAGTGSIHSRLPDPRYSTLSQRSPSLVETQVEPNMVLETESFSDHGISTWLQTPRHSLHRSVHPVSSSLHFLGLAGRDDDVSPVQPSSGSNFHRVGTITRPVASPVKFYGQTICLPGDEFVSQSPVWSRNPTDTPRIYGQPVSLLSSSSDPVLENHAFTAE